MGTREARATVDGWVAVVTESTDGAALAVLAYMPPHEG